VTRPCPAAEGSEPEAFLPPANRVPLVRTGDAFDLVQDVADGTVDLILTSPPYWGLRTYGHEHNHEILAEWKATGGQGAPGYGWYRAHGGVLGLEPYPAWYIAHLAEFFRLAMPKLRLGGSLWLNVGDTYFGRWSSIRADGRHGLSGGERERRRTPTGGYLHDKQLLLVPSRAAIALQDDGWILRNDVIWSKSKALPRPETDRLRHTHEHFFHFVRRRTDGRPAYYYDLSAAEPGYLDVVSHSGGRSRDGHTATFPASLIEPRIRSSCPPGGFVLDPFCGTGRTLEVAVGSGRLAQGFELSKSYAAAARANVRAARLAQQQIAPGA
jgi:site-specific DNA-methyltransferase (cytosine-N4-specific)